MRTRRLALTALGSIVLGVPRAAAEGSPCPGTGIPGDAVCHPIVAPIPVSGTGCWTYGPYCATDSFDLGPASCGPIERDVFYEWEVLADGVYTVTTTAAGAFVPQVVVYPLVFDCPIMVSPLELACGSGGGPANAIHLEITGAPRVLTVRVGISGAEPEIGELLTLCIDRPLANPGALVATSYSSLSAQPIDPLGYVVGVVDARVPPAPTTPVPVLDQNWSPPIFHNEGAAPTEVWNAANLGQVFGVTLDDSVPPNIYVAATSVYGDMTPHPHPGGGFGPGGPAGVYRLDGVTGDITTFLGTAPVPTCTVTDVTGLGVLPNDPASGPALGDICFDRIHRQFFVSNLEDGKIYRVSPAGIVLSSYDPFDPDDGCPGFAPLGERVWAVATTCCFVGGDVEPSPCSRALYFSVWQRDRARPSHPGAGPAVDGNSIWMVPLDDTGDFAGDPELVAVMPPHVAGGTWSSPVSDIAFGNGRMVVAERAMYGDYGTGALGPANASAHRARVLEYECRWHGGPLRWALDRELLVGRTSFTDQNNSAGGVDYDDEHNVWATGDYLHYQHEDYIYGLQRVPSSGNAGVNPPTAREPAHRPGWRHEQRRRQGPHRRRRDGVVDVHGLPALPQVARRGSFADRTARTVSGSHDARRRLAAARRVGSLLPAVLQPGSNQLSDR